MNSGWMPLRFARDDTEIGMRQRRHRTPFHAIVHYDVYDDVLLRS